MALSCFLLGCAIGALGQWLWGSTQNLVPLSERVLESVQLVAALDELRREGAACVTIPLEDCSWVLVSAAWTDQKPRQFRGETLLAALQAALAAREKATR